MRMRFFDTVSVHTCLLVVSLFLVSAVFIELRMQIMWNKSYFLCPSPSLQTKSNISNFLSTLTQTNATKCETQWVADLELFLPVPPNEHGLQELRQMILPTLGLFWPVDNLRLLLLTDGEGKDVGVFADRLRQAACSSGIAKSRVLYNFLAITLAKGWDRQQWLMFWADNFTTANYVGFLDSDTVFVTRVTKTDLFVDERPIVRALYGKPQDPYFWPEVSTRTFELIGHPEPFSCMTYFPVIIKLQHLVLIREYIRQRLNKQSFDEAFALIAAKGTYSQFSLMCAYLWYYKRDDYFWIIGQRDPSWKGPFAEGQVKSLAEAGIEPKHMKQRPHLAVHWNYEKFKDEQNAMKQLVKTGVCFSMTEHVEARPSFCNGLVNRTETVNKYEWTFEGYTFINPNSKEAHLERLRMIDPCPHKWNRQLISNLTL